VGGAGDDEVTVDFAYDALRDVIHNPLPPQGLIFHAAGGEDNLVWKNTPGYVWKTSEGVRSNATPLVRLDNVEYCTFVLADNAIGDAQVIIDGAALRIKEDNGISSNAAVKVMGGGILDLNGKTLSVPGVTVADGNIINGTINAGWHLVQQSDNGAGVGISANLGGTGPAATLRKEDSSTAILSGANTYLGGTFVNNGILRIQGPAALPAGGPLTILAGASVVLVPNLVVATAAAASAALTAVSAVRSPVHARWQTVREVLAAAPAVAIPLDQGGPGPLPSAGATDAVPVVAGPVPAAPAAGPVPDVASLNALQAVPEGVAVPDAVSPLEPGASVLAAPAARADDGAKFAPPRAAIAPKGTKAGADSRAAAHDAVLRSRPARTWLDGLAWSLEAQGPVWHRRTPRQGISPEDAVARVLAASE
jgi:autotransporter-associated beta strand protein